MNKKYALAAIVMVAVVMGISTFAPAAMAAPNNGHGKVAICHFDYNANVWESDKMVNPHALIAHQGHGDKIIDNHDDAAHITVSTCEAQTLLPPRD